MTAGEDLRDESAAAADVAVEHPLVEGAIAEFLDNVNLPGAGLPSYGVRKVAHYAAQVARAQALGIDADALRHTAQGASDGQERIFAGLRAAASADDSRRDLLEALATTLAEVRDALRMLAEQDELVRVCRVCGCTDERACLAGCSWTDIDGVCSACITTVLSDVQAEENRQDAKWGEQNHPDGTGPDVPVLADLLRDGTDAAWLAVQATEATDVKARDGAVTWRDILLEEVFEALAESSPEKLRTELVQVAAVAAQWVKAKDRQAVTS